MLCDERAMPDRNPLLIQRVLSGQCTFPAATRPNLSSSGRMVGHTPLLDLDSLKVLAHAPTHSTYSARDENRHVRLWIGQIFSGTGIARRFSPGGVMRSLIWAWRPCPFNQVAAWRQGADKAVGAAHGAIRIEFQ